MKNIYLCFRILSPTFRTIAQIFLQLVLETGFDNKWQKANVLNSQSSIKRCRDQLIE